MKSHSKVHIQAPGCWKELDDLADRFVKEVKSRADILKKAEDFINKVEPEEVNKPDAPISTIV